MNRSAHWCSRGIAIVAWLVLSLCATVATAQEAPKSGDDFLQMIDSKRYAESWDAASEYFRQAVSKTEWVGQLRQVREPLGTLVLRTVKSATPQKDPAGAPAGDYLLVTYQTTFSSSPALRTETLPMVKTADGQWRVVGYFIR